MLPVAQILGLSGLFASRTFLPAFVAALVLRFGAHLALFHWIGLTTPAVPDWFTHDSALVVLGLLSALEFASQRSETARQFLVEVDHFGKPIMAALVALGLFNTQSSSNFSAGSAHASIALFLSILLTAVGTFWSALQRNRLLSAVHDADPDDALHLQRLLGWAEELFAGGGAILLLIFPVLMAGIAVAVLGAIYGLQRRAKKREDNSRVPCPNCGTLIYGSARACSQCGSVNPCVHTLTWLGSTSCELAADLENHAVLLVSKKRCPRCATRFTQRSPNQSCSACGMRPFADANFASAFDRWILARLPLVLLASALLGSVPIIGLLPAVLLYRLQLVTPFRQYLPRGANVLLRWGLRILFFFLVLAQLLPTVGAISIPIMALANWGVYRHAFRAPVRRRRCRASAATNPTTDVGSGTLIKYSSPPTGSTAYPSVIFAKSPTTNEALPINHRSPSAGA